MITLVVINVNRPGSRCEELSYLPLVGSKTLDWVALLDSDLNIVGHAPVDGFCGCSFRLARQVRRGAASAFDARATPPAAALGFVPECCLRPTGLLRVGLVWRANTQEADSDSRSSRSVKI